MVLDTILVLHWETEGWAEEATRSGLYKPGQAVYYCFTKLIDVKILHYKQILRFLMKQSQSSFKQCHTQSTAEIKSLVVAASLFKLIK